ncbi:MAG: AAA family ATPase, partial [Sulfuricurvum sp.]
TCQYDKDTKELTINENKEHVSIFPDNINVTAIVGENGSGKSSVLVGITNHKAIFKIGKEYFSRGFDTSKITAPITVHPIDASIGKLIDDNIIYLDFDLIKINPIKDYWDFSNLNIYDKNLYFKVENGIVGDNNFSIHKFRENFFNLIVEHQDKFKSDIFTYNPEKISLDDYLHAVKFENLRWISVNQLIKQTETHPFSKNRFLLFLLSNLTSIQDASLESKLSKIRVIEDLEVHADMLQSKYIEIYAKDKPINFESIYTFFDAFQKSHDESNIAIKDFIPLYRTHKEAFLKLFDIAYLQINFTDAKEREFFDVSQGERKFFTESMMIFDAIHKNPNENLLLVLDEPDLTLHPQWQKRYLNELLILLSNFSSKKFHIIITSHSPFILSDIPKENVIFLEKDEGTGNCKNVTNETKIETFGANIHTLLSHGFFMKDGLMGEFAKEKINEAIKYLNQKTLTKEQIDYCENIISIIGEPILKRQLQKMLDSKRLIKIDDIDQKIRDMEYELSILKKHQNKATNDELKDRAKRKYSKKKIDDKN